MRSVGQTEGLLVLSDVNYPGWQATLDGEAAPIVPANYLFRGVFVPAGEHVVTFRYAPRHWRWAWMMSLLGLVLAVLLLAGTRFVRSHSGGGV